MRLLTITILALCTVFFSSCKKQSPESISLSDASQYITSHTKNYISPNESIYVRFSQLPYNEEKIGTKLEKDAIMIKPAPAGYFYWSDNQTISYKSEDPLDYDQQYNVSVDLSKLYDNLTLDNTIYAFPVHTDQMYFSINLNRLETSDQSKLYQYITISTNKKINSDNYKDLLDVRHESQKIELSEFIAISDDKYEFKAGPIVKADKRTKLSVRWNIKDRNASKKSEIEKVIPSIGDFSVLGVNVTGEENKHIEIQFSQDIKKQKLDGLVRVENYNGSYKFSTKKNILHVYLDKKIYGTNGLSISKNVISAEGVLLSENYLEDILFAHSYPAVRSEVSGNIVPHTDQVIFPFEAISLDSVEVQIFEIFSNNVQEALRYGNLNRADNNQYLGRVIHTETLSLNAISSQSNINNWVRYAIDIRKLTDIEPGAIYQIRIGYMKSYTDYNCEIEGEERPRQSAFDFNGYYSNYNYNNRSNPCFHEYYDQDKFIYRNILASNLGLLVKKASDKSLYFVASDLRNVSPLSEVELDIYDTQGQIISKSKTGVQGMAQMQVEQVPHMVIAKKGNNYAYLNLNDNLANPLSEFDVSGVSTMDGINGFLYGERGVWRPGDTLHLGFMIIDSEKDIASTHPVRLKLKDSKGIVKYNQTTSDNKDGIFIFQVPTSQGDPTGLWTAQVEVGNYSYTKRLKVETIKPNRLKVDLAFDGKTIDVSKNETFTLESSWLHGAPASQLEASVDIKYTSQSTAFDKYKNYDFTDPSRKINSTMNNIFKGKLNDKGQKLISIDFGKEFRPPGKLSGQIRTRVYEKSGNYSEDYSSIDINPYDTYAGVSVPQSRWGSKILDVENDEAISFVSVDSNGKPMTNRKLTIGLYEARWNWWYNRSNNDIYRYNSMNHLGSIDKTTITTGADGKIDYVPELTGHGRFLVRVCDKESGHCSGTLFYTSRYRYSSEEEGAVAKLLFTTDKKTYQPNESMEVSVPSNADSKLLVSIENNEEVLSTFWVEGDKDLTKIPIDITEAMQPNVYVHVTLIQGTDKNNDLPVRLYGVAPVTIVDKETVIQPQIDIAKVIRPNQKAEFTIREKSDRGMSYTVAVVDEGLLDITNFKTPDPWSHFYAKQSLGVNTWDVYDYVLNRHGGDIEKIISIGGDGVAASGSESAEANRFRPVVQFLGSYTLSENESKTHTVDIPNYVGSLRVIVVAKQGRNFGHASKNVIVKDPLMLQTTLPRVLAPNESLSLPVNVFAYNDDIRRADINLELTPNLNVNGSNKGQLAFEKQGDKLYNFDINVGQDIGIAKLKVDSKAGKFSAYEELEIEIRNPAPIISKVSTYVLEPNSEQSISFENIGIKGSNEAYVELSQFPDFNLEQRLQYVMKYPYGCVEQTTSSVFPQLYLADIMKVSEENNIMIARNIKAGIKRLLGFQNPNGGLSYWPGNSYADDWGTSYAGHFIIEAKRKGYFIPNGFFQNWLKYQKQVAKKYKNNNKYRHTQMQQAYRLYTLALAGEAEIGAMNALRNTSDLSKVSRFLLAISYAKINQKNIAEKLIKGLDTDIKSYRELSHTYGSGLRDRSIILLALMEMDKTTDAYKLAVDIADQLSSNRWYSTQTTAFTLMSLSEFLSGKEKDLMDYTLSDGANLNITHTSDEVIDVYQLDVSNKNAHNVKVKNNSKAQMYVRLVYSGKPLPEPQPSYDKDLKMDVKYVDRNNRKIDPTQLKLGTDFKAIVKVTNTSLTNDRYDELALNHTIPSGWEIQNLRIGGVNTNENSSFNYQDIRDDRVYTFFDLKAQKSKKFVVPLTAAYAGRFFMPNVSCAAMYDEEISCSEKGAWVEVTK